MPTIKINDNLWTCDRAGLGDGRFIARGETIDVTDEEWETLRDQKTGQFSKRYRIFTLAEGDVDEGERTQVRLEELESLTPRELRSIAVDNDIEIPQDPADLVDAIREHFAPKKKSRRRTTSTPDDE